MNLLVPAVVALAAAAGPPTAIVDVDSPDTMVGLAGQVTRALVSEAQAQQFDLRTPEQLRTQLGAQKYEALRKCGGKVACVAQSLEGQGLQRAVVGQLSRDDRNYLLKLWFIDLSQLSVIADVDRAILIASRRFQHDFEQAIPPLLRGEREARGTLVITANVKDAQVSLNGDFMGTPPLTLPLKPGKYEVKIERRKYLPFTRLVAVEANEESRLEFQLLLIPGETPDTELPAMQSKTGDANAAAGPSLSAGTWILGGVALAAGGTGLAFGLIARGQESTLNDGYDSETGVYQGTRAQALEQNRNAIIADVAFGVAGAALIGTIVSAVVDGSRPVTVTPTVTPGGGGISLGGTF